MSIKLDLKDRKILAVLDGNSRMPTRQIAKKVQLSVPAVEHRIERFHKKEIIFSYYTVIDFARFGYSQYKIYFKFQNTTLQDEKKIVEYWKNSPNAVWVGQIRGRWDLAVSFLAKSNYAFGRILSSFMNIYSKYILEKDILLTEYSPIYSREYFADTESKEFVYGAPKELYHLDEIDRHILSIISTDARISIVGLVEKTNITRDVITYRMKKLKEAGVIVHYSCYLNLKNLGVNLYKIIFRTKNFNEESERAMREYVATHEKATQFLKLIGSWDLEIEFETENEDELYKILTDIRKKFASVIRDFDILRITDTFKYDYFPFDNQPIQSP